MAFGDRVEVGAGEHERIDGRLGVLWVGVCTVLEDLVEDFDWAAFDHHRVRGEGLVF